MSNDPPECQTDLLPAERGDRYHVGKAYHWHGYPLVLVRGHAEVCESAA